MSISVKCGPCGPPEFLRLHEWQPDPRPHCAGYWNHPLIDYPVRGWPPKGAIELELLNQQWLLLERCGWEIEDGRVLGEDEDRFLATLTLVRSPPDVKGRRDTLSPHGAFRRQRKAGWGYTLDKAVVAAVRHGNDLYAWCPFCGVWHTHGAAGLEPGVGESAGHWAAHCTYDTPFRKHGYTLDVKIVLPAEASAAV